MEHDINEQKHQEIQISPIEDLMREHGVLKRILLIYNCSKFTTNKILIFIL